MSDKREPPLYPFETRLAASWPPEDWKDLTVLVAVSGGGDSVALLRGLAALKLPGEGRLIAAHVNHKLRGADSDADQAFVQQLCRQVELACEVATVTVDPTAGSQGIEATARRVRYAAMEEMAGRLGARFVVTAHTADDQAETILHRILRGTGIRGLSGMSRSRRLGPATLLRPLLGTARAELAAYLRDRQQPFRTDVSNYDVRFTRNRIRKELLPRLAAHYNPTIVDALLRLGELAGESQSLIDVMVCDVAQRCLRHVGRDEVRLDLNILAAQPLHLVREVLMEVWRQQGWPLVAMGFAEWGLLAAMISATTKQSTDGPRKRMFPGAIVAEIREDALYVRLSSLTFHQT
ncbi:MAG: tRNA lysidine(34) synthetase TilS [Planctomycetota bacterium]